jgi:hypothetical protein
MLLLYLLSLRWLLLMLLVRPLGSSLFHRHRLPLLLHATTLVDDPVWAERGVAGRLVHRRSLGAEAPHSSRTKP